MGALHYFLGIQVQRTDKGFFLHQEQYALDLLSRADILNCRPYATPADTSGKLSSSWLSSTCRRCLCLS